MAPMVCIMSQARDQSAIDDLENGSFRLGCGVGTLIENAPHMAIALRGAVALGNSRALVLSRARSHPRRAVLGRSECRGLGTHFFNSTVQLRTRLSGAGVSSVLMVLVRNFFPSGKTWIYRVEFHEMS
jgi:hypothetical protein